MKAFKLFPLFMLSGAVLAQAPDEHASHQPPTDQDAHAEHQPASVLDEHAGHLPAPTTEPEHHIHDAATPAQAAPMAATMRRPDDSAAMQEARHMSMLMHGESLNYLLLGERFEFNADDGFTWEAQGWIGRDLNKLWLKTEGHYDTKANDAEQAEIQALYSRAVAPFWDLQAGLRHDDGAGPQRSYAVVGLMGLAPYWFEIDSALFLSERGDLSARVEAEYDLRFTQKLLLQPRVELNFSFADDPAVRIGKGVSAASVGLRLRYEFRREFAPYVGVEWSRAYGNSADLLQAAGDQREELTAVAGVRFWY